MSTRKLRVGVVGCGQIADAHIREIRKLETAEIAAVCDSTPELADRAAACFSIPTRYYDIDQMLEKAQLDVVHVTTPAHTHKDLAMKCLRAGCHVYVEKPFSIDVNEAREVLSSAEASDKLVCVGHNELFDPVWLETRELLAGNALGQVIHVESLQGFDLSGPFGSLIESDPEHWARKLPGLVFHNTISHPVYKILECFPGWTPRIEAHWLNHKTTKMPIPTELRVSMHGEGQTATLWVSSAVRPVQRIVRIYGSLGSLEVDFEARSVTGMAPTTLRGPFVAMQLAGRRAKSGISALSALIGRFLRSDIHYFAGLNEIFRRFYVAILDGTESPVTPQEILRVTAVMDEIFESCKRERA